MAGLSPREQVLFILVAAGMIIVAAIAARRLGRRAHSGGYRMGSNVLVRCRDGHLFRTTWVPYATVTAVRLGRMRYQFCPVGRHWSLVTPVTS